MWIRTFSLQMTDTHLKISLSEKVNLLTYEATEYRGGTDFRDSSSVIRLLMWSQTHFPFQCFDFLSILQTDFLYVARIEEERQVRR